MVADPDQLEKLAEQWLSRDDVTIGHMFGWVGLKAGRRFFALLIDGRLVVKLSLAHVEALVAEGIASQFDPGWGRVKKSWADLGPSQLPIWDELLEEAYRQVLSFE